MLNYRGQPQFHELFYNPLKNIIDFNSINSSQSKKLQYQMLVRMRMNINSPSELVGIQSGIDLLEYSLADTILTELNMTLPHSPVITLLGIYPTELKTYVHSKICTQMLITTLFIITEN